MNRTVFIVWLLVFYLALVAGWSAQAHDGHPVSDNMCGSPGYGDCYTDSQWIGGWYHMSCHVIGSGHSGHGGTCAGGGTSFGGSPARVPSDDEVDEPQSTGGSSRDNLECYQTTVTTDGREHRRCVSEQDYFCTYLTDHHAQPSNITCD